MPTPIAASVAPWYTASTVSYGSSLKFSQSQAPSGRWISQRRASALRVAPPGSFLPAASSALASTTMFNTASVPRDSLFLTSFIS